MYGVATIIRENSGSKMKIQFNKCDLNETYARTLFRSMKLPLLIKLN